MYLTIIVYDDFSIASRVYSYSHVSLLNINDRNELQTLSQIVKRSELYPIVFDFVANSNHH